MSFAPPASLPSGRDLINAMKVIEAHKMSRLLEKGAGGGGGLEAILTMVHLFAIGRLPPTEAPCYNIGKLPFVTLI